MKKLIVLATAILLLSSVVTSCSSEQKKVGKHSSQTTYICPMDCESGKMYKQAGTCPVCGMDLEEKSN